MTERAPAPARAATLVIGYGNDLRRDDAAGRRAAEQVGDRGLPGVRVLSVPQLAPEHVVDVAACARVVFVDASIVDDTVTVRPVVPCWPGWRTTHHLAPASLLGLARTVGDVAPPAVVVTIPISDAAVGLALSPRAAAGVRDAVARIVELCDRPAAERPAPRDRSRPGCAAPVPGARPTRHGAPRR